MFHYQPRQRPVASETHKTVTKNPYACPPTASYGSKSSRKSLKPLSNKPYQYRQQSGFRLGRPSLPTSVADTNPQEYPMSQLTEASYDGLSQTSKYSKISNRPPPCGQPSLPSRASIAMPGAPSERGYLHSQAKSTRFHQQATYVAPVAQPARKESMAAPVATMGSSKRPTSLLRCMDMAAPIPSGTRPQSLAQQSECSLTQASSHRTSHSVVTMNSAAPSTTNAPPAFDLNDRRIQSHLVSMVKSNVRLMTDQKFQALENTVAAYSQRDASQLRSVVDARLEQHDSEHSSLRHEMRQTMQAIRDYQEQTKTLMDTKAELVHQGQVVLKDSIRFQEKLQQATLVHGNRTEYLDKKSKEIASQVTKAEGILASINATATKFVDTAKEVIVDASKEAVNKVKGARDQTYAKVLDMFQQAPPSSLPPSNCRNELQDIDDPSMETTKQTAKKRPVKDVSSYPTKRKQPASPFSGGLRLTKKVSKTTHKSRNKSMRVERSPLKSLGTQANMSPQHMQQLVTPASSKGARPTDKKSRKKRRGTTAPRRVFGRGPAPLSDDEMNCFLY